MTLSEKVAYLKGLETGLHLDANAPQTKIFATMTELFEQIADEMAENGLRVDEIDRDLGDLEKYVLAGDTDVPDELYEVICPKCGEDITINGEVLDKGSIICPTCGAQLEFDVDEIDDRPGDSEEN